VTWRTVRAPRRSADGSRSARPAAGAGCFHRYAHLAPDFREHLEFGSPSARLRVRGLNSHGFRAMAATRLNETGRWNPDAIEAERGGAVCASGSYIEVTLTFRKTYSDPCGLVGFSSTGSKRVASVLLLEDCHWVRFFDENR
jgi:hypothetical protein